MEKRKRLHFALRDQFIAEGLNDLLLPILYSCLKFFIQDQLIFFASVLSVVKFFSFLPCPPHNDRTLDGVENAVVYSVAGRWLMMFSEGMEDQYLSTALPAPRGRRL
jgi:hypothetical protein